MDSSHAATLLLHCKDKAGIVLAVTDFVFNNGGNVIELDQHIEADTDTFYMRIKWELQNFQIQPEEVREQFNTSIASNFEMSWSITFSDQKPKIALFVSHLSHCLYDLLFRVNSGEWNAEIPIIISNHEKLRDVANRFNVPFHHVPVNSENKPEAERQHLALLKEHNVDLVVLARYMQIISPNFIKQYEHRVINIHHSFLPAFPGAKPYHSAYERGVKIIGATSHYVTPELDAGPIIDQDITRVDHKCSIDELKRRGQDLEKLVLSKAVRAHIEQRVLVFGNKTVVFR
jgi:formyltetrahydrofolate deformylase